MRLAQVAQLLELREDVPDRRGREAEASPPHQRLGGHGLAGFDVLADEGRQDPPRALAQDRQISGHNLFQGLQKP